MLTQNSKYRLLLFPLTVIYSLVIWVRNKMFDFKILKIKKIYMYEVLQHFEYGMLRKLLNKLALELEGFSILIGSIPDQEKILEFYNTAERKAFLFYELLEKKENHIVQHCG